MSKFGVQVTFSLGTTIEPEVNDFNWDNSQVTDFEGGSYFSSEDITCQGGELSFTVEQEDLTDEDSVKDWVREEIINEGSEIEDSNGITWVIEDLDIEVEAHETPLPSLDEALDTLSAFAEEKREDEYLGEIARSAIVVIDAFRSHAGRIASLETQVATLVAAAAKTETNHPF